MSPASKSKSKDKQAAKAAKEQLKASSKSSASVNGGNGIPGSAYNPVSGTFYTLETVPSDSPSAPSNNGRFQTIDEMEEQSGSSLGTMTEYDSVSNNGSSSSESAEDQKDKTLASTTSHTEPIPGSGIEKRDKIRQKNGRKHQRKREKRAQEIHERCSGYLMSRKLELLARKLVVMGFSPDQATMALMSNEGRLEESVIWLLEGGDDRRQQNATSLDGAENLNIDISEELAKLTNLEKNFKCTRKEVERAVVVCEGDLDKAAETLNEQRKEAAVAPRKPEDSGERSPLANGFKAGAISVGSVPSPTVKTQQKVNVPFSSEQQRRDERDFNYTKATVSAMTLLEPTNNNLHTLKKIQTKPDWPRQQVAATVDKRWSSASAGPSVSYSASPMQVAQIAVPPTKPESRHVMGSSEARINSQPGALREPVIVMQRPQSHSAKPNLPSMSNGIAGSPPVSGWYANGVSSIEMMKMMNGGVGHNPLGDVGYGLQNLSLVGSNPHQFYSQNNGQPFHPSPMESGAVGWGNSVNNIGAPMGKSPSFPLSGSSKSLAAPSSLGLFSGLGSGGSSASSSLDDWSTGGSMRQRDYSSIDWSLNVAPLYEWQSDTWSRSYMGVKAARPSAAGSVRIAGLQDGGNLVVVSDQALSAAGSHEWTSPFTGKDIFVVPRQFVKTPSL